MPCELPLLPPWLSPLQQVFSRNAAAVLVLVPPPALDLGAVLALDLVPDLAPVPDLVLAPDLALV